jgi:hypothetical protein
VALILFRLKPLLLPASCFVPSLACSRQSCAGRGLGPKAASARRSDDCGGRCSAPTSLRCSPRGRAAKLASRAAPAALEQIAASQILRSALRAPTPRLRCSAPQTSLRLADAAFGPNPRPAHDCRSGNVDGVRATTLPAKGRAVRRGCALCAAEKRSGTGGARSARRPSFSRRWSERSSRQRAQRVSPRQPVPRASQGTPAKRGQAPGAPAAHDSRLCPRLCRRHRPRSGDRQ